MNSKIKLSPLPKTWFLDLDGTLVYHNEYINGKDKFLPGALEFLEQIPSEDCIIIATSRGQEYEKDTKKFLEENGVKYTHLIMELPYGERILVNDMKPSGLVTSIAISKQRDEDFNVYVEIDEEL